MMFEGIWTETYAAAIKALHETPLTKLGTLLAFSARVFDLPQHQVESDLLAYADALEAAA